MRQLLIFEKATSFTPQGKTHLAFVSFQRARRSFTTLHRGAGGVNEALSDK
jgi:hypothetical protein